MSLTVDSETTTAPVERRRWYANPWLTLPVGAGVAVFLVNNILLTRLLTMLPGGTALAPTTMLGLGWAALRVRRFGSVTLLYATYGFLGTLGHLGVDAGSYVAHLPRLLLAALLFDTVLAVGRSRRWALAVGVLPCAGVLLYGASLSLREWLIALGLAWAGLGAAALAQRSGRRRVRAAPTGTGRRRR